MAISPTVATTNYLAQLLQQTAAQQAMPQPSMPQGSGGTQVAPVSGGGGGVMPMPPSSGAGGAGGLMGGNLMSTEAKMAMLKSQGRDRGTFQGAGGAVRDRQMAMQKEKEFRQQAADQAMQLGQQMNMQPQQVKAFAQQVYEDPSVLKAASQQFQKQQMALQEKQKAQPAYYQAALMLTGNPDEAKTLTNLMIGSQEVADQVMLQAAQKKYDTTKASQVNVQMPNQPMNIPDGFYPNDPEAWFRGDPSGGLMNLKDVGKQQKRNVEAIEKGQRVTKFTNDIRRVLDDKGLPATGFGGAVVRKATGLLDDPNKEGEVGLFDRFTNAGEVDALLEPIKSVIGLQTINQMREMSATGGALGNVSNFEVRVVQAALDSLDPTRDEKPFRKALDNVDTAFARAGYLAKYGDDMVEQANKAGVDPVEYISNNLNKKFPINEEFMKMIGDAPDDTPPEMVDPNKPIQIPTGQNSNGWSIRPAGS